MLHRSKLAALLVLVCVWPALAWGQQEMRSATKGASTPLPITGSAIDADHNALDVKCLAGCTGGGGAGDASLAEQQAQTAILTTIDADTGTIAGAVQVEDNAHSSGQTGIMMLGVRNDNVVSNMSSANGDYTPIAVSPQGQVYVNVRGITPGTTATDFGKAEDAVHSTGDTGVAILTKRTDTAASSADTNGDYATLNTDATGRVWTNTELPDAATLADDTANPTVPGIGAFSMCWDGTNWDRCVKGTGGNGAVDANTQRVTLANDSTGVLASIGAISTSVTPGTSAAHLGKAEDAAHTTGDTGVMALCVRSATPTDRSVGGTDGDYEPCAVDASGRVHVSANLNTIGGNAISTGIGATGTGVQRVAPVSSSTTGAAPPAAGSYIVGLGSGATGGFLIGPTVADSFVNINVSTATTTLLVTGVSGRHVRISALNLVTAGANNVALISGTGATCGTGTTGMNGGTTAASGWNFPANGGIAQGSGIGTINQTNATGDSVCIVTSAATQLSGRLAYAIY